MVELEFPGTELAPGTAGRPASGAEAIAASGQDVVLTFGDGSRALGHMTGNRLIVEGYDTRAGADVDEAVWRVHLKNGELVIRDRLR